MALATYKGSSGTIRYKNIGQSTITANQIIEIGNRLGVAATAIAVNATGIVRMIGKFQMPATAAEIYTANDLLFWDTNTSKVTSTPTDIVAGTAAEAKAESAATAIVNFPYELSTIALIGDMSSLETTANDNLVNVINEIHT